MENSWILLSVVLGVLIFGAVLLIAFRQSQARDRRAFQRPDAEQNDSSKTVMGLVAGILFGVGIGLAIGISLDNIAVGLAIGIGSGTALGAGLGQIFQAQSAKRGHIKPVAQTPARWSLFLALGLAAALAVGLVLFFFIGN